MCCAQTAAPEGAKKIVRENECGLNAAYKALWFNTSRHGLKRLPTTWAPQCGTADERPETTILAAQAVPKSLQNRGSEHPGAPSRHPGKPLRPQDWFRRDFGTSLGRSGAHPGRPRSSPGRLREVPGAPESDPGAPRERSWDVPGRFQRP